MIRISKLRQRSTLGITWSSERLWKGGGDRFLLSPTTFSNAWLYKQIDPRACTTHLNFSSTSETEKMASSFSSSKQQKQYRIRSISLPSRSHPRTLRVTEELNKLKTWEATASPQKAETILIGLSGLAELYDCVQDLLQTPRTKKNHLCKKWVDEMLDGSERLLDICDTSRSILLQMKETAQDLQMVLRKRGGEYNWENSINSYICRKKKAKKEIEKCLGELKRLETKSGFSSLPDLDHHLSAVVSALREASSITICVFRSLLSYISSTSRAKPSKWSLVTKLLQKEQVASKEDQHEITNEVEGVDVALYSLCGLNSNNDAKVERVQQAQKRLKALEVGVEGLEDGLERLLKSLIQARVNLLNNLCH